MIIRRPLIQLSCAVPPRLGTRLFSGSENAADHIWIRSVELKTMGAPHHHRRQRTVVLLGYAGSPRRHLDQFADLYAQLGAVLQYFPYGNYTQKFYILRIFLYSLAAYILFVRLQDCRLQLLIIIYSVCWFQIQINIFPGAGVESCWVV